MLITNEKNQKKLVSLQRRWEDFKYLRSINKNFGPTDKHYLTMLEREDFIDQILHIIFR